MAASFNQGILFLLSAPFAVVGAIALLIYRARRNAGRTENRSAPRTAAGARPFPGAQRPVRLSNQRVAETAEAALPLSG